MALALETADATALASATESEGRVRIVRHDGLAMVFPLVWLRDNCRCPLCIDPGNGQRLFDTASLPDDLHAQRLLAGAEALTVIWPDGHESCYPAGWLAGHALENDARAARRPRPIHWGPAIAQALPQADWRDVEAQPAAERKLLDDFLAHGFAIVRNVPTKSGMVTRVGDRIGHVRVTNYGRWFEVKSVPNPNNLAYTGLALGTHTDNPYRDPTPGVQLLHCLENSAPGGDSILVDGFAAAEEFRKADPEGFALLASVPQDYRFADREADLRARQCVISIDADGQITDVHFNNRSKAPLDASLDVIEPWYRAYRAFARMLADPARSLVLHLMPGDLLMMANQRALHGRTGFDPAKGRRHLQGCYVDMDGVGSRWRVLNRESGMVSP